VVSYVRLSVGVTDTICTPQQVDGQMHDGQKLSRYVTRAASEVEGNTLHYFKTICLDAKAITWAYMSYTTIFAAQRLEGSKPNTTVSPSGALSSKTAPMKRRSALPDTLYSAVWCAVDEREVNNSNGWPTPRPGSILTV
jgi:hypothetical protein